MITSGFILHTLHLYQPLKDVPFQLLKHDYKSHNNDVVFWGGGVKQKTGFLAGIHEYARRPLQRALYGMDFENKVSGPLMPRNVIEGAYLPMMTFIKCQNL